MSKKRVLFICVHNSARSQMAEAFLNKYGGDRFEVESAGLEPGKLNPVVVEVMKDESQSGSCSVFPGKGERLHWGFDDPSKFVGTNEEKLERVRAVRDNIKQKIQEWLESDF